MTLSDFEALKIGDYVYLSGKNQENDLYVVLDDYAWGPPLKVCLVENKAGEQCQISTGNFKYWERA